MMLCDRGRNPDVHSGFADGGRGCDQGRVLEARRRARRAGRILRITFLACALRRCLGLTEQVFSFLAVRSEPLPHRRAQGAEEGGGLEEAARLRAYDAMHSLQHVVYLRSVGCYSMPGPDVAYDATAYPGRPRALLYAAVLRSRRFPSVCSDTASIYGNAAPASGGTASVYGGAALTEGHVSHRAKQAEQLRALNELVAK
eukprot:2684791-Rhodomonas_salina.2